MKVNKAAVYLWGGIIFSLILVGTFNELRELPFHSSLAEYVSLKDMPAAPINSAIHGKAIIINRDTGDIDRELWLRLPDELRAKYPAEVRLVIFSNWSSKQIATYWLEGGKEFGAWKKGVPGYQMICDVQIVDMQSRATVVRFTVMGSPPPNATITREVNTGIWGIRPTQAVIERILSLYRPIQ
jgi:hypothetical protein